MATQGLNTPKTGARGRAGKAAAKGRTKGQAGGAAGADNARTDSSATAVATPKPKRVPAEIKAAAARCAALGDPARLQILEVMQQGGSFSPAKIGEQLGIEGKAVNEHLRAMGRFGFFDKTGERQNAEYTISSVGTQAWQTARTFGGNSGNTGA